jgi:hypothetical protein
MHMLVLLVESTQHNKASLVIFQSIRPVCHYNKQPPLQIRLRHMRVHYRLRKYLHKNLLVSDFGCKFITK